MTEPAHVGRHHAVAGLRQHGNLLAPRVRQLGETVAQDHERSLALLQHVQLDAVDAHVWHSPHDTPQARLRVRRYDRMAAHAPAVRRRGASIGLGVLAQRVAFVGLLAALPLLPHLTSDGFEYPAVSDFWSCAPFCALLLLATVDLRRWRRLLHLDLLVLLSFVVALGCLRPWRLWPALLIYPPLIYLFVRMVVIARVGRSEATQSQAARWRLPLGRAWLLAGVAVLLVVHVAWAQQGTAVTDVDQGGVRGALSIVHGRALYGAPPGAAALDPHTDTYGPVDYESYIPFALLAGAHTAARLTTLLFDLLCALLLFVLGRRVRGPDVGVLLAFCWLAYPFTLYEDALGFNDSIVAAALVATVLVAHSPSRRGAVAALACWTKFSPLALLPALLSHRPSPASRGAVRGALEFGCVFAAVSAVVFIPALAHSGVHTLVARTFGFQSGRVPSGSMWEVLQAGYGATVGWLSTASRLAHGLLAAFTGAFAVALARLPRRRDAVGLAAACAAVLIAVEACLNYYSLSYVLWFAPLVLIALLLQAPVERARPA